MLYTVNNSQKDLFPLRVYTGDVRNFRAQKYNGLSCLFISCSIIWLGSFTCCFCISNNAMIALLLRLHQTSLFSFNKTVNEYLKCRICLLCHRAKLPSLPKNKYVRCSLSNWTCSVISRKRASQAERSENFTKSTQLYRTKTSCAGFAFVIIPCVAKMTQTCKLLSDRYLYLHTFGSDNQEQTF